MQGNDSLAVSLASRPESERWEILQGLGETEAAALEWDWRFWARPNQLAPEWDWLVWILRAGRGFGKTRSGAGWAHERALAHPGRWMAWVAKTPADARDFMVEGPGGILRNAPPAERPNYEPSKRRLSWPNGSWATIFSSEDPDALRGFSGDSAWLDELFKYKNPRQVWDALQFGMREASQDQPRQIITSTPRPHPLLLELESLDTTAVTTGSSYENRANLDPVWLSKIIGAYEGTALGDQEIHAKILDVVEGRVYSSFQKLPYPEGNIDASVRDTGAELFIGQDFNINPMASVIGVRVVDELHILDALEVFTSNTEELAEEYQRRYPGRKIIVCPDPAGKARSTSAPTGQTDHTILQRAGFEVRAPEAAPLVVDRENNTNALFARRKIRIHPRAEPLIRALSNLTYKEGTRIRDKGSGWDHVCDGLDYLCWQEFNILEEAVEPARPFRWRI